MDKKIGQVLFCLPYYTYQKSLDILELEYALDFKIHMYTHILGLWPYDIKCVVKIKQKSFPNQGHNTVNIFGIHHNFV